MKYFFTSLCLLGVFSMLSAQNLAKVTIKQNGDFEYFSLGIDNGVTINLSKNGNILEYGEEVISDRNRNLTRLEKFMGRVENYTEFDNEAFKGKVKYIGLTQITYFASYDKEELRGKIRSIGTMILDYYSKAESDMLAGYIKSMGSYQIQWYSNFDNEAMRGKLKAVGITNISYYASYDDQAYRGKLKSIGNASFTYYSSNERREYAGMMKTGSQMQYINGIRYYIKY